LVTFLALLWISIFTVDYLAVNLGVIDKYFTLIPEIFSLFVVLIVAGRFLIYRQWAQPLKYVWLFVAFALTCMIAAVAESVNPGALVLGLRNYFKFLPFLFLPAVYRFSDKQLTILVGLFFLLVALQVPLSFFQRFVQFADRMHTGDPIRGTVTTSSALTLILCLSIALVMTLYVHRKIAMSLTLVLFCYLIAPTTINETKATLILLPLATLGPFLLSRGQEGRWRKVAPVLALSALGVIAFATIYNTMIEARWGGSSIGEFVGGGQYESYLYRGVDAAGPVRHIGRLDSMILPVSILSKNWMQLMFGLGIGNVSPSSLPGMEGEYSEVYGEYGFGMTSIGNLLWETGIVGLTLYLVFFVFIWRDTRRVYSSDDTHTWYSSWWATCIGILLVGLSYKSILSFNEFGYLLFFWSGILASRYWESQHPSEYGRVARVRPENRLQLAARRT
jgi:hypothetical protein